MIAAQLYPNIYLFIDQRLSTRSRNHSGTIIEVEL